jgi:hypothetical protein
MIRWLLWASFGPLNAAGGAGTTLTIVALIADVGRDHVATATSCEFDTLNVTDGSVISLQNHWSSPRSQSVRCFDTSYPS